MVLLLCIAIVILIGFLIGGIAQMGVGRARTQPAAYPSDSIRLPLAVMMGMMLMCLVGLVWAGSLPRQAAPEMGQAMISQPAAECCMTTVIGEGNVTVTTQTQQEEATPAPPPPPEEPKETETNPPSSQPCGCDR